MRFFLFFFLFPASLLGHSLNSTLDELYLNATLDPPKWRYGLPEDNTPVHFHLSFAGPQGMSVTWETDSDTQTHVCYYGTESGQLNNTANGNSRTYGTIYSHTVLLSNLSYLTRYYYSCGDKTAGMGPQYSFVSSPLPADKASFSVAVIGDMGIRQSNGVQASMLKHIDTYDFALVVGDLGYADNWGRYRSTYEGVYSEFMSEIEPISSQVAFMGLPGNHEATCNEIFPFICKNYLKNFTAYRTRWRFPSQESGGSQNMWYSFDYGLIHWVQISTETDFPSAPEGEGTWLSSGPFGDQLSWLSEDLAKANSNRGSVPWIIVSGHRPIFYSSPLFKRSSVQDTFLPMLEKYNVDIYFAGHEHNYERYFPINSTSSGSGTTCQTNYNDPSCPIYIVNGAGGNNEGHQKGRGDPDYLAFRDDQHYGWGRLTLVNYTSLTWEFITDEDITVDSVTFVKNL